MNAITPSAMKALMDYSWPGNVRELENVIYQAMINTNSNTLDVDSLSAEIFSVSQDAKATGAPNQEQEPNLSPTPTLVPWDELQKQAAISALDGQEHDGRALKVNEATPREPRSGGGGGYGGGGGGGGRGRY